MVRPSERVVQAAHPELTPHDVRHTAEAYRAAVAQHGGTVSEMAVQSRNAEQRSQAGNDVTT